MKQWEIRQPSTEVSVMARLRTVAILRHVLTTVPTTLWSVALVACVVLTPVFSFAQPKAPYGDSEKPCYRVIRKTDERLVVSYNPNCDLRRLAHAFPILEEGRTISEQRYLQSLYALNGKDRTDGLKPTVGRGCVRPGKPSPDATPGEIAACPDGLMNYYAQPTDDSLATIIVPFARQLTFEEKLAKRIKDLETENAALRQGATKQDKAADDKVNKAEKAEIESRLASSQQKVESLSREINRVKVWRMFLSLFAIVDTLFAVLFFVLWRRADKKSPVKYVDRYHEAVVDDDWSTREQKLADKFREVMAIQLQAKDREIDTLKLECGLAVDAARKAQAELAAKSMVDPTIIRINEERGRAIEALERDLKASETKCAELEALLAQAGLQPQPQNVDVQKLIEDKEAAQAEVDKLKRELEVRSAPIDARIAELESKLAQAQAEIAERDQRISDFQACMNSVPPPPEANVSTATLPDQPMAPEGAVAVSAISSVTTDIHKTTLAGMPAASGVSSVTFSAAEPGSAISSSGDYDVAVTETGTVVNEAVVLEALRDHHLANDTVKDAAIILGEDPDSLKDKPAVEIANRLKTRAMTIAATASHNNQNLATAHDRIRQLENLLAEERKTAAESQERLRTAMRDIEDLQESKADLQRALFMVQSQVRVLQGLFDQAVQDRRLAHEAQNNRTPEERLALGELRVAEAEHKVAILQTQLEEARAESQLFREMLERIGKEYSLDNDRTDLLQGQVLTKDQWSWYTKRIMNGLASLWSEEEQSAGLTTVETVDASRDQSKQPPMPKTDVLTKVRRRLAKAEWGEVQAFFKVVVSEISERRRRNNRVVYLVETDEELHQLHEFECMPLEYGREVDPKIMVRIAEGQCVYHASDPLCGRRTAETSVDRPVIQTMRPPDLASDTPKGL